jgi:hypothetical protein
MAIVYALDKHTNIIAKIEAFNGKYGNVCRTCESKTLADCLECADCGYCMNDFSSKCVAGDVHGPFEGKCQKWYQNDPYTRAVLSNNRDYKTYEDEPIFDVPRAFGHRSYV